MRTPDYGRRRAFTLIELLVVIAIIAVLVGLTTAAVMRVLVKGPEVQTRVEIGQLGDTALASVRTEFNLTYVPSSLVLREDGAYVASNPAHTRTKLILRKMFGSNFNPNSPVDWNNNGSIQPGDIVLQGQHCLVFFTGGIPTPPSQPNGCLGWPSLPGVFPVSVIPPGTQTKGPWFEFKSDRLVRDSNGFFRYLDPFRGQPYAYFSSTAGNDYTPDCPALSVLPYQATATPPVRFVSPNGYQIISAGRDKAFGPGGPWNPASGTPGGPGADDMASFSARPLGAPQQ